MYRDPQIHLNSSSNLEASSNSPAKCVVRSMDPKMTGTANKKKEKQEQRKGSKKKQGKEYLQSDQRTFLSPAEDDLKHAENSAPSSNIALSSECDLRSNDADQSKGYTLASVEDDMYEITGQAQDNIANVSTVDGLCGTEEKIESFRVRVTDPAIRSGTTGPLNKYIVYLVRGYSELCGEFSSRKRYSDFQWLRDHLVLTLPGTFIPPLPRKQKLGRFEDEFVESRRSSLEEFLARLLNRKSICNSSLFRAWLSQSEFNMDELKKEFAECKTVDVLNEYKIIYTCLVKDLGSCSRSHVTKFIWFRQFLHKHLNTLQELHSAMNRMASLHCSQSSTISGCTTHFCQLSRNENEFMDKIEEELKMGVRRIDISEAIFAEAARKAVCPSNGYDVMIQIIAREIQDTESVLDATSALDRLINMKHQTHHQIDKDESFMRAIQKSSRGSFVATWFQRKDKETQINEIRINVEKLRLEILNLDELIDLARLVLITNELPLFVSSKVTIYNKIVRHFVHQQAEIALEEASRWSKYMDTHIQEDGSGAEVRE